MKLAATILTLFLSLQLFSQEALGGITIENNERGDGIIRIVCDSNEFDYGTIEVRANDQVQQVRMMHPTDRHFGAKVFQEGNLRPDEFGLVHFKLIRVRKGIVYVDDISIDIRKAQD